LRPPVRSRTRAHLRQIKNITEGGKYMASKGEQRVKVGLVCSVCKNRNYITTRNKINTPEKLKLKKFCKHCRKVNEHKETEKLK